MSRTSKNLLAVLFVVVTQFGCAAYWSMDLPPPKPASHPWNKFHSFER